MGQSHIQAAAHLHTKGTARRGGIKASLLTWSRDGRLSRLTSLSALRASSPVLCHVCVAPIFNSSAMATMQGTRSLEVGTPYHTTTISNKETARTHYLGGRELVPHPGAKFEGSTLYQV